MESVAIVYIIITLIWLIIYIGTTVYIIVNSRKNANVNAALWVVLNLLFAPIGFIGYLIARR